MILGFDSRAPAVLLVFLLAGCASHVSLTSQPDAIADLILEAAGQRARIAAVKRRWQRGTLTVDEA